jgi:hypothetical protein
VVRVQDFPGLSQVQVVFGGFVPGKFGHPLQVIADHLMVRGGGGSAFEPVQLPVRLLLGVWGQLRFLQLKLNLLDLPEALVGFPQFLLQGLDVLPQIIILLGLLHLPLDLALDLLAQLQHFQFAIDEDQDLLQTLLDVNGLQELLFFFLGNIQAARDDVRQDAGIAQFPDQGAQFRRQIRREFQHLQKQTLGVNDHGLGFQVRFVFFRNRVDLGHQIRVLAHPAIDAEAIKALDQEAQRTVFGFPHLQDGRGGTH